MKDKVNCAVDGAHVEQACRKKEKVSGGTAGAGVLNSTVEA